MPAKYASQVGTGSGSDWVLSPQKKFMKQDLMEILDGLDCCETFQYAELLTDEFISKNTSFRSVHEFFVFPFTPEDCTFNELDNYVKRRSNFKTWKEFLYAAWTFTQDSNNSIR